MLPQHPIVLVRDGFFEKDEAVFQNLQSSPEVEILSHFINLGKGRALKTGFNHILNKTGIEGVVTVDADGQHRPEDVVKVVQEMSISGGLILGSRFASASDTPLRSRIGNTLTRFIFRFLIGLDIRDTQTGLRGIPRSKLAEMMQVSGERYEYETNVLIHAKRQGWRIREIDIETVYINQNRGSHFHPLLDSMRIYFVIFRFLLSSVITSAIDFFIFSLMISFGSPLPKSILSARLIAGIFNFFANKEIVFKSSSKPLVSGIKYWALVAVMGALSYLGTRFLNDVGWNIYLAKVSFEVILFLFSFVIQRDIIFERGENNETN